MGFCKLKIVIHILISHLTLIALPSSPEVQTAVFKGVPDNWANDIDVGPFVKVGQKYYYVNVEKRLNWFDAVLECRKKNAQLPSIETGEEYDALDKHFKSLGFDEFKYFWTSGNDLGTTKEYYWLGTGNPIGYARWGTGEPSSDEEHCVQLKRQDGKYHLNDVGCLDPNTNYFCEAKTPKTVAITVW